MIRVLIADDHAIVRKGLREVLSDEFKRARCVEVGDGDTLVRQARSDAFDIVLMDLNMPGLPSLSCLAALKRLRPTPPVLVLSVHPEEEYAVRVLQAGAAGYLTKHTACDELVSAIRKVLEGGRYVSPVLAKQLASRTAGGTEQTPHEALSGRETEVMGLIAAGKSTKEIGFELRLSPKTVAVYRSRLFRKLGATSTVAITRYALKHGLVE